MSARVYLFADFGKGPRVVRSVPAGHAEVARMVARGNRGDALAENWDKSPAPWWLVECESAEAGRVIIAAWSECGPSDRGSAVYHDDEIGGRFTAHPFTSHQAAYVAGFSYVGRILASGGAA